MCSRDELEELASYYDTHDTAGEMAHGRRVDPRPMRTTSLRLPVDVAEALKEHAHQRGLRYTTLLRMILEEAVRNEAAARSGDLAEINQRLARIEAALAGQPAHPRPSGPTGHAT